MEVIDNINNTRLLKIRSEERPYFDSLSKKYRIKWNEDLRANNIFPISRSIVGYINTPYQSFELKSKYNEINFNHILRIYLYTIGFSRDKNENILDVTFESEDFDIAREYLNLLAKEIQIGIHREYKYTTDNYKFITGKVNYKTSYLNQKKNYKFPIEARVQKLSTNTLINSLIVGALLKISKNSNYRLEALHLKDYYVEVKNPVTKNAETIYKHLSFNSHTIRFKQLLQLAVMIIDNSDYSDLGNNAGIESFLINFDKLFENFIIEILLSIDRDGYNHFTVWNKKQNMLNTDIFQDYRLMFQPDLLYKYKEDAIGNTSSYAVLDCKNKAYNIFSNNDVYQMISYNHALNSDRSILIYPSFLNRANKSIVFNYERFMPTHIYACFINIAANNGDDFLRNIDDFRNKIISIIE